MHKYSYLEVLLYYETHPVVAVVGGRHDDVVDKDYIPNSSFQWQEKSYSRSQIFSQHIYYLFIHQAPLFVVFGVYMVSQLLVLFRSFDRIWAKKMLTSIHQARVPQSWRPPAKNENMKNMGSIGKMFNKESN